MWKCVWSNADLANHGGKSPEYVRPTLTTNCLSSEPEDRGVDDLSRSIRGVDRSRSKGLEVRSRGVRGGVSRWVPPSIPSLESECSDPNDWVIDNRFFWKYELIKIIFGFKWIHFMYTFSNYIHLHTFSITFTDTAILYGLAIRSTTIILGEH